MKSLRRGENVKQVFVKDIDGRVFMEVELVPRRFYQYDSRKELYKYGQVLNAKKNMFWEF